jgi:hypothetical protein
MKLSIEFDNEQIVQLVRSVQLANWVVNATKSPDEQDESMNDFKQYVLAAVFAAGKKDLIHYDKELDGHFLNGELEEDLQNLIDDYDEDIFWEELVARLADRDWARKHGSAPVEDEGHDARYERMLQISKEEEKYGEEFEEFGIEHLELVRKPGARE